MASGFTNVRSKENPHTVELWLDDEAGALGEDPVVKEHPLDSEHMRKVLGQLQSWYYEEREKQAVNRYQMAIDEDFYDNLQWSDEDAAEVESRGQAAIVYNECAPMVDWIIGTQRRSRVDWSILPRAPSDVAGAEIKTQVLKYVSDVNKLQFHRSRAFDEAIKAGLGWLEDGARADPTKDILYSSSESWRNMLHDSCARELDLSDGRYVFRWRWVDLDIALTMYPDRAAELRKAAVNHQLYGNDDDDLYYLGQRFTEKDQQGNAIGRRTYVSDPFFVGQRRQRVKLIECWYRVPTALKMISGPVYDGEVFDSSNPGHSQAVSQQAVGLIDQIAMRMHWAVMTENTLMAHGPSPYRHQRFPFTPIWCFRRSRDGLPYGPIRRARDVQEDLNKRASKALFMLSTNQIVAEEGAVEDWDEARDEVDRPDGVVIKRKGKEFEIRRDAQVADGHMKLFEMNARKIQSMGGVNNENQGRQSNSGMSGEAIKALQMQGSVATTTPFDNQRYAIQVQGEKILSNTEQFYSEPKVIRLTEAKGQINWVQINHPEVQPDGSVRWLNDITASQADFVVSEQDFHGSLRHAMFENMMDLASKLPPDMALRLLRMAFDYSDMPNKDEIVAEIRKLTGEPNPNGKMTPEEMQELEGQRATQEAMFQQQQAQAAAVIAEQSARAKKINAEAEKVILEVQRLASGVDTDTANQITEAVRKVQAEGASQVERVTKEMVNLQGELNQARIDLANRTTEIGRKADTELEVARINADAKIRAEEIAKEANSVADPLLREIEQLGQSVTDLAKRIDEESAERARAEAELQKTIDQAEKDRRAEAAKPVPAAPAPAGPPQIIFQPGAVVMPGVPAGKEGKKTLTITGPDGKRIRPAVSRTLTIKGKDGKEISATIDEKKNITVKSSDGKTLKGSLDDGDGQANDNTKE